jgi:hypothetical protein
MRQRHALISRVMQLRRIGPAPGSSVADEQATSRTGADGGTAAEIAALEVRIAHLEQMIEGLQDSVHRASIRNDERLSALEAQLEPGALAVARERDARERGL